jgi:hypothetical protein
MPTERASHPTIEITPTVEQYEQLCRDLSKLRQAGALSNTAAIVDALHHAAGRGKVGGARTKKAGRRRHAPGTATGGLSPDAGSA